jgi:hypothetical protein
VTRSDGNQHRGCDNLQQNYRGFLCAFVAKFFQIHDAKTSFHTHD